jgi:nucleoside-diphosphate-sugar epimerase
MNARVLFLGGNGMIGSAVAREAVAAGVELTVVTRSEPRRPVPDGVRLLRGDVRDPGALAALLGDERWDAVVNWVAFTPQDLAGHVEYFGVRTGQYVFISTCSVYARPVPLLPITESSPRRQPVFGYARDKIACELLLEEAYREDGFPLTILRPFHTYDETTVPLLAGWTAVERMRAGAPVVVAGDGSSLWTLMHSSDLARAVVPLLGAGHAIGESVNVVSGDILTWDQIHLELARAAGVRSPLLTHRSSETSGTRCCSTPPSSAGSCRDSSRACRSPRARAASCVIMTPTRGRTGRTPNSPPRSIGWRRGNKWYE